MQMIGHDYITMDFITVVKSNKMLDEMKKGNKSQLKN